MRAETSVNWSAVATRAFEAFLTTSEENTRGEPADPREEIDQLVQIAVQGVSPDRVAPIGIFENTMVVAMNVRADLALRFMTAISALNEQDGSDEAKNQNAGNAWIQESAVFANHRASSKHWASATVAKPFG